MENLINPHILHNNPDAAGLIVQLYGPTTEAEWIDALVQEFGCHSVVTDHLSADGQKYLASIQELHQQSC